LGSDNKCLISTEAGRSNLDRPGLGSDNKCLISTEAGRSNLDRAAFGCDKECYTVPKPGDLTLLGFLFHLEAVMKKLWNNIEEIFDYYYFLVCSKGCKPIILVCTKGGKPI